MKAKNKYELYNKLIGNKGYYKSDNVEIFPQKKHLKSTLTIQQYYNNRNKLNSGECLEYKVYRILE